MNFCINCDKEVSVTEFHENFGYCNECICNMYLQGLVVDVDNIQ